MEPRIDRYPSKRRHIGGAVACPRVPATFAAILLALLLLGIGPLPAAAFPEPPYLGPPDGFGVAETDHARYFVEQGAATDAGAFAIAYGVIVERAHDELSALLGVAPEGKIPIYAYASDATYQAEIGRFTHPELLALDAVGDSTGGRVAISLPRLQARSPLEAENALRHSLAHVMVGYASQDLLPRGFAEGIAQYVERPATARQARIAALLQSANQRGSLLSWSDINRPRQPSADPDVVAAHAYAVVAFLIDRHGLRLFRDFVTTLPNQPDWRSAMRTVYNRSPTEIEEQWRENLPRWVAGGWRTNIFAAFDLEPAKALLTSAHYAAANDQLEQSLRLYMELGDVEHQAEVEALLRQGEVGIQAETVMGQVQEALEQHTYDRAHALVEQAQTQYDQLPVAQRPVEMLTTYANLATAGLEAGVDLESAQRLLRHWSDYPEARGAALDAGQTFARLGDEEMLQRTNEVLNDLDVRQRRLVLMLGALAALTVVWLMLWIWARGPAQLSWR